MQWLFLCLFAVCTFTQTVSFLAIGDWGSITDPTYGPAQKAVAGAMAVVAHKTNATFVVNVGDNFYPEGVASSTDPMWQRNFVDVYAAPSLQVPWFSIMGNHDYMGSVDAQIQYKQDPRWTMPDRNFTFSVKIAQNSLHLIFLDTSPFIQEYYTTPSNDNMKNQLATQKFEDQLVWLETQLQNFRANSFTHDWIIVLGHHPIYTSGGDESTELQQYVRPLLLKYNVTTYVSGHKHDLEELYDGQITYILSGAGSRVPLNKKPHINKKPHNNKEVTVGYSATIAGFVTFELTSSEMTANYFGHDNSLLYSVQTSITGRVM